MDISQSSIFSKQLELAQKFQSYASTPVSNVAFTAKELKNKRDDYLASRYVRVFGKSQMDNSLNAQSTALQSPPSKTRQFLAKFFIKPLEKYIINSLVRFAHNSYLTDKKLSAMLSKELLESQRRARDKIVERLESRVLKITSQKSVPISSGDLVAIDKILDIVRKFDQLNDSRSNDTQKIHDVVQKTLFQKHFHKTHSK